MMKIALVNGSARADGNTAFLLSQLEDRLDPAHAECLRVDLAGSSINYCLGCHMCQSTKKCVQADDMANIYRVLEEAGIILIASPSYWGYVTGQLKVFFDRSTPYCDTHDGVSSFPKGKMGVAIALRAGLREDENATLADAIEHYFGHLGIEPALRCTFEGVREKSDLTTEDVSEKLAAIVEKMNSYAADRKSMESA